VLRSKGFGGVGVADIMKAADLTHGGFYSRLISPAPETSPLMAGRRRAPL
jgi:hypothetical protein